MKIKLNVLGRLDEDKLLKKKKGFSKCVQDGLKDGSRQRSNGRRHVVPACLWFMVQEEVGQNRCSRPSQPRLGPPRGQASGLCPSEALPRAHIRHTVGLC